VCGIVVGVGDRGAERELLRRAPGIAIGHSSLGGAENGRSMALFNSSVVTGCLAMSLFEGSREKPAERRSSNVKRRAMPLPFLLPVLLVGAGPSGALVFCWMGTSRT